MSTTVTTPNELEIRVERIFDAPRTHVFSVWTDPELIPEWWGDGTVVEEMDVRPGGTYRFRTAFGVVEGEFREVEPPERLVQTFQNHLQTLEFEDLGERTKLTQTMRFETTEQRDTTMQYGVEEGAKAGFARIDALLRRSRHEAGGAVACAAQGGHARAAAHRGRLLGGERGRAGDRPSRPALAVLGRRGARPRDAALVSDREEPLACRRSARRRRTDARRRARRRPHDGRRRRCDRRLRTRNTPASTRARSPAIRVPARDADRIRAWREANEGSGRLLMREGVWLPLDG